MCERGADERACERRQYRKAIFADVTGVWVWVGHRLALLALEHLYDQPQEYSRPLYTGMEQEPGRVRFHFSHATGSIAKGGPLRQFAVAGTDQKFVPAEARIDGDSVLVSSPSIPEPVVVCYAGGGNPEGCNLYNAAGLPASPFRTDE